MEDRRQLRALLRALIAERDDCESLYVPRGEAGMRRTIDALLLLRPAREHDPLQAMIAAYRAASDASSASPTSVPENSARTPRAR